MANLTPDEKVAMMRKALAVYFECAEDDIGNFVIGLERQVGANVVFSGGWSGIPHWYLLGLVNELREMINTQRNPMNQPQVAPDGEGLPSLEEILRSKR